MPVEDKPADAAEAMYLANEYDEVFNFEVVETKTDTKDGGTDIKFEFIIKANRHSGPHHDKLVWVYSGHVTNGLDKMGIPELKRDATDTFLEHITGKRK